MKELVIGIALWEGANTALSYGLALAQAWKLTPRLVYTGGTEISHNPTDAPLRHALKARDYDRVYQIVTDRLPPGLSLEAVDEGLIARPWQTLAPQIAPDQLLVAPWGALTTGPWPLLELRKGPVLLVPPATTEWRLPEKIIYATNFDEPGARIPAWLEMTAHDYQLTLSGVHVITQNSGPVWAPLPPRLGKAFRLDLEPGNLFFYTIFHARPATALATFVSGFQSDWLCIGYKPGRALLWKKDNAIATALKSSLRIPLLLISTGHPQRSEVPE